MGIKKKNWTRMKIYMQIECSKIEERKESRMSVFNGDGREFRLMK